MSRFADKLFVVNKESGPTSFDVVDAFRRATGLRKVGHSGTLDPLARGVLLLCTGKATRAVEYFMNLPKTYAFEVRLGIETTTLDAEGEVVREMPCPAFADEDIRSAAAEFIGDYDMEPPAYSAVKKQGKRLYEFAREGKHVKVEKRRVVIYDLEVENVELPLVHLRMKCSRGTYVRSFARDFGERLGVPAHVSDLVREAVGPFAVDAAFPSGRLFDKNVDGLEGIAMSEALDFLPGIVINDGSRRALFEGGLPDESDVVQRIDVRENSAVLRILDEKGELLAVGSRTPHPGIRRFNAVDSYRLFVDRNGR